MDDNAARPDHRGHSSRRRPISAVGAEHVWIRGRAEGRDEDPVRAQPGVSQLIACRTPAVELPVIWSCAGEEPPLELAAIESGLLESSTYVEADFVAGRADRRHPSGDEILPVTP